MLSLRYLLPGLLLLLIACGSENAPAAGPAAASPEPQSTPEPTPTPFNLDFTGGRLGFVSPDQLGAELDFPQELISSAPQLEPDQAASIAREFLNNTRVLIGDDVLLDLCEDGSGITQLFSGVRAFENQPFSWVVAANTAGEWNQPSVTIEFDDPALDLPGFKLELMLQAPDEGSMPSWFPSGAGDYTQVFDNPSCDQ